MQVVTNVIIRVASNSKSQCTHSTLILPSTALREGKHTVAVLALFLSLVVWAYMGLNRAANDGNRDTIAIIMAGPELGQEVGDSAASGATFATTCVDMPEV